VSASTSKSHSFQAPPRVNPPAIATSGTSRNPGNNVQYFSCRGRGRYAYECPHRTLAIEHDAHEPLELEEEVVDPEGGFEDLVDVENSLHHDAHLGIARCPMANPIMSVQWKRSFIFYALVRCGETLMKMVIDNDT